MQHVIAWASGDLNFLKDYMENPNKVRPTKKDMEYAEASFGADVLTHIFPNCKAKSGWAGKLAVFLVKRLLESQGIEVIAVEKQYTVDDSKFYVDLETEKCIYEVKSGAYYMSGTAHEKLEGAINKYSIISECANKPVKIVIVGGLINQLETCNTKWRFGMAPDDELDEMDTEARLFSTRLTGTIKERHFANLVTLQKASDAYITTLRGELLEEVNLGVQ